MSGSTAWSYSTPHASGYDAVDGSCRVRSGRRRPPDEYERLRLLCARRRYYPRSGGRDRYSSDRRVAKSWLLVRWMVYESELSQSYGYCTRCRSRGSWVGENIASEILGKIVTG